MSTFTIVTGNTLTRTPAINLSDKQAGVAALFAKESLDAQAKASGYINLFLESYGRLIPLRFDTGRALAGLKKINESLFAAVCRDLGISLKTAGRYIKIFEDISVIDPTLREVALRRGFDLAESDNLDLRNRLKQETRAKEGIFFTLPLAYAIFEHALSDLSAEQAAKDFKEAEERRMNAEEEQAARKAKLERMVAGEGVSLEEQESSESEQMSADDDADEEEPADSEEITGAVNTPRKGLRWFVQDWVAKGKKKEQVVAAVFAAYDRETSRLATREMQSEL